MANSAVRANKYRRLWGENRHQLTLKTGTRLMLRFAGYLVERALIRITSDPSVDLVLYVVADNPIGESTHYPDSNKWIVRSPERKIVRTANQDYYEGEE